jgi:hypothetical protein
MIPAWGWVFTGGVLIAYAVLGFIVECFWGRD